MSVKKILDSGVLFDIKKIVALGGDWYRSPFDGRCYNIIKVEGEWMIADVRHSKHMPGKLLRLSKVVTCQFCQTMFRVKARGPYKWCRDCRREQYNIKTVLRMRRYRLRLKKQKEKQNGLYEEKKEQNKATNG